MIGQNLFESKYVQWFETIFCIVLNELVEMIGYQAYHKVILRSGYKTLVVTISFSAACYPMQAQSSHRSWAPKETAGVKEDWRFSNFY